jgi:hypothetical protein
MISNEIRLSVGIPPQFDNLRLEIPGKEEEEDEEERQWGNTSKQWPFGV